MAHREKLAWVMIPVLILTGLWYIDRTQAVLDFGAEASAPVPPILIGYVILIVLASIAGSVLVAASAPSEAEAPADEREARILDRAGHWSGYVLGAAAIAAMIRFTVDGDGNRLFHLVFAGLILSQIAEYALQILFYRRGV
ncbi:MAG: hypothetical protein AAFX03_13405 [Pseudomonadota bacterium]